MKSKSIYEDETPKSDSDKGRIPIVQMGHHAKKEKR